MSDTAPSSDSSAPASDFRTVPAQTVGFKKTSLDTDAAQGSQVEMEKTENTGAAELNSSELPPPPMPPGASGGADLTDIAHSIEEVASEKVVSENSDQMDDALQVPLSEGIQLDSSTPIETDDLASLASTDEGQMVSAEDGEVSQSEVAVDESSSKVSVEMPAVESVSFTGGTAEGSTDTGNDVSGFIGLSQDGKPVISRPEADGGVDAIAAAKEQLATEEGMPDLVEVNEQTTVDDVTEESESLGEVVEPDVQSEGLVESVEKVPDPVAVDVQEDTGEAVSEPLKVEELGGSSMAFAKPENLLELLQNKGILSKERADEISFKHVQSGMDLESILIDDRIITSNQLKLFRAELNGIPIVDLGRVAVSPEAMAFIPQAVAERFEVLAYDYDQETNRLSVAMADPMDLDAVDFLQKKTRTILNVTGTSRDELSKVLKERYGVSLSSEVKQVLKETDLSDRTSVNQPDAVAPGVIREAPISKIVAYVLEYAMKTRASDVHIEPQEDRTRIRYRIDGILLEKLVLPKKVQDALVSRIKILSDLKIDEKRLPQDGRFNFKAMDQEVDLRVSTLPTVNGEKVVMRLLKKSGGAATLQELGLRGRALKILQETIVKPHGIILVTGPTGSGKTTTLYSVLTKLNNPKVNIMTLEDPVEYQMEGINQVQVNAQIGLTFASGLRAFLRQDPNIIMVGEIRDSETADLAIQASLTGHLVLSTLHTNNSAGAMPRLLDMGAESFLLASTLVCVVAQRVVRLICEECKHEVSPPAEKLDNMKEILGKLYPKEAVKLYEGAGCEVCGGSGYKGRVAIFEVLPVTEKIAKMILERESAGEIEKTAIGDGMLTMKQDGYLKVLEGITTIEEVLRVADA